eukprot:scaffold83396_cov28-Tisochrysis_lutea.AAC.8
MRCQPFLPPWASLLGRKNAGHHIGPELGRGGATRARIQRDCLHHVAGRTAKSVCKRMASLP